LVSNVIHDERETYSVGMKIRKLFMRLCFESAHPACMPPVQLVFGLVSRERCMSCIYHYDIVSAIHFSTATHNDVGGKTGIRFEFMNNSNDHFSEKVFDMTIFQGLPDGSNIGLYFPLRAMLILCASRPRTLSLASTKCQTRPYARPVFIEYFIL
jgi:hypothetical protein